MEVLLAIADLGTFGAIVIGGLWALVKARKTRQFAHRVEFDVDVSFVARHQDYWVASVDALVRNKGAVQHKLTQFEFELRGLYDDDPITRGTEAIGGQLLVPNVVREGSWLGTGWTRSFIEPGLTTKYSYVAEIPSKVQVLLLHGILDYEGTPFVHTAEKLLRVPEAHSQHH